MELNNYLSLKKNRSKSNSAEKGHFPIGTAFTDSRIQNKYSESRKKVLQKNLEELV